MDRKRIKHLDPKWIKKIEAITYNEPIDPGTQSYNLTALLIAYSGLSLIDLGKHNVLKIHRTEKGRALVGIRVKTRMPYKIPITKDIDKVLQQLKPYRLPWEAYVDDEGNCKMHHRRIVYQHYDRFLKNLSKKIGLDEPLKVHTLRGVFRTA
jgi:hypothetical protein